MVGAANGWLIVQQGFGGGGLSPGSSQFNPIKMPGRINACPPEAVDRERAVHLQYIAKHPAFACVQNAHRGKFFEVEFSGGRKGIYQGSDGECRGTHAFFEIVDPGC